MIDPLFSLSGFAVGMLVGMTGVGGGSLMTPLLILLFGIHPATAVGTDLLYAAATKTGGSVAHGWAGSIHWPAVFRLAGGSIPASILTLVVLWQLDLSGESSRSLVNLVLCFALLLTAASLIFRKAIMERYRWRLQQFAPLTTARFPMARQAAPRGRLCAGASCSPAAPGALCGPRCGLRRCRIGMTCRRVCLGAGACRVSLTSRLPIFL